ncbi:MAG: FAD-binding protein [Alphaproteobacteria bacterium]|nr:FAD-binding protein [Alphaproteobacteria bacterium]
MTHLTPADDGYAEARQGFNLRNEALRPDAVVVCRSEGEVIAAIRRAAGTRLRVAGRRHGLLRRSEGAPVVEIQLQTGVLRVERDRLVVGPDATLGQISDALLSEGRALPLGDCASVGIAGLTLGGGLGPMTRALGLTCDSLEGARMVDGRGLVRDSADDPLLLEVCRGGGGGRFGVVTELRFRTHPAPQGLTRWRFERPTHDGEDVGALAELWYPQVDQLPDAAFSRLEVTPGRLAVTLLAYGDPTPVSPVARALAEALPLVDAERFDAARPEHLLRDYAPSYLSKSSLGFHSSAGARLSGLSAAAQEILTAEGEIALEVITLGGALAQGRGGVFAHRGARFFASLHAAWRDPLLGPARLERVARVHHLLDARGRAAHYCNFPHEDPEGWDEACFGRAAFRRLRTAGALFDPEHRLPGIAPQRGRP